MKEFFTENGIYYRTNNIDPKKKTLVLIHGVSGSSSAWLELEDHFKDDCNIVSLDLRGHGLSKKLKEYLDYDISLLSRDVREITEILDLKNIVLISHSFGTLIGLDLIFSLGDKTDSVVFVSPIFNVRKVRFAKFTFSIISRLANMMNIFPFSPGKGGHVDYSKYRNTGDWNARVFMADIMNTSFRIYFFCMKHLYAFRDADSLLKNITKPTLIIHGTKDTVMPLEESVRSSEKIPNCRFIPIKGGSHVLVRDKSDILSEKIEDFMKSA